MGEYYFKPKVVRVKPGQSVRFVNVGTISHTVADTDRSGRIRSRLIHPRELRHGQSQTVRFTKAGTVRYVCTFHPALMKGRVVVGR
jgi:plastocyanin